MDAKTYLPISVEMQQAVAGQTWTPVGGQDVVYKPLNPSLFDPSLLSPAGVVTGSVSNLPGRLNIISRKITGQTNVVLLNASVNSRGDLYIAYTGEDQVFFEATDDEGNKYLGDSLLIRTNPGVVGLVKGQVFVPVAVPLKPRRRKYTIHYGRPGGPRGGEEIVFSVKDPDINTFPPLGGPRFPLTPEEVLEGEAQVLARHYMNRAILGSPTGPEGAKAPMTALTRENYLKALGLQKRLIEFTAIDVRPDDAERVSQLRGAYGEEAFILEQLHRTKEAAAAYRLGGFVPRP